MSQREHEGVSEREGALSAERDRTVAGMDEKVIQERLLSALRVFIERGFESHLIGIKGVGGIDWRIELKADGVGPVDLRELTAIGDQQRIDLYVDKVEDGVIGITAYARH